MVRFHFHLIDGDQLITDEQGCELPDLSAARREAELAAREFLAEAIKAGNPHVPEAFVISDEAGRELGRVARLKMSCLAGSESKCASVQRSTAIY
jgi:hypothetical protein